MFSQGKDFFPLSNQVMKEELGVEGRQRGDREVARKGGWKRDEEVAIVWP
jgi:hypothetical protein